MITNINRLRSPLLSWLRSSSQVSISEDMSTWLVSRWSSWVRVVITVVMPRSLSRSRSREITEVVAPCSAVAVQARHGVEHGQGRVVLGDQPVEQGEVLLEAERGRADRLEDEQARVHPPLQVDADRAHVAHQLRG